MLIYYLIFISMAHIILIYPLFWWPKKMHARPCCFSSRSFRVTTMQWLVLNPMQVHHTTSKVIKCPFTKIVEHINLYDPKPNKIISCGRLSYFHDFEVPQAPLPPPPQTKKRGFLDIYYVQKLTLRNVGL